MSALYDWLCPLSIQLRDTDGKDIPHPSIEGRLRTYVGQIDWKQTMTVQFREKKSPPSSPLLPQKRGSFTTVPATASINHPTASTSTFQSPTPKRKHSKGSSSPPPSSSVSFSFASSASASACHYDLSWIPLEYLSRYRSVSIIGGHLEYYVQNAPIPSPSPFWSILENGLPIKVSKDDPSFIMKVTLLDRLSATLVAEYIDEVIYNEFQLLWLMEVGEYLTTVHLHPEATLNGVSIHSLIRDLVLAEWKLCFQLKKLDPITGFLTEIEPRSVTLECPSSKVRCKQRHSLYYVSGKGNDMTNRIHSMVLFMVNRIHFVDGSDVAILTQHVEEKGPFRVDERTTLVKNNGSEWRSLVCLCEGLFHLEKM